MKISDLRVERVGGMARLAASICWEDSDRPAGEYYYATPEEFAQDVTPAPHAFLCAAIMPALEAGEQRILLEDEVCPVLQENLITVMQLMQHWNRLERAPLRIEAKTASRVLAAPSPRAGLFLTGGVDSLATLRVNRLQYPSTHPGSVKDGIIVFGLEVEALDAFRHVLKSLSSLADHSGVTLLPVYTNIRQLNSDWRFWYSYFMGAALSGVAHALGRRLSIVSIASDYDIPHLKPHGSHPLVEPHFSSYDLRIRCDGITLSRLAKIRVLADWDLGLQHLRVCNKTEQYSADHLNCGECEKCLRTMLGLLIVGRLDATSAFRRTDVSEALVAGVDLGGNVRPYYEEMLGPLEHMGRSDLARLLRRKLAPAGRALALRRTIARFDRDHLNGSLMKLRQYVRG
jgi:hypothetical protein